MADSDGGFTFTAHELTEGFTDLADELCVNILAYDTTDVVGLNYSRKLVAIAHEIGPPWTALIFTSPKSNVLDCRSAPQWEDQQGLGSISPGFPQSRG